MPWRYWSPSGPCNFGRFFTLSSDERNLWAVNATNGGSILTVLRRDHDDSIAVQLWGTEGELRHPTCGTEDAFELTRRAYEAGVMIAAGTDGMTPPDSVFPALHEEIRLLHDDVGMPMLEVLKAASLHGAVALGLENEIGTLEPGKHANIAFLGEDPLAGAESLRSVELTVKRGTLYYRRDFVLGAPPQLPGGLPGR